MGVACQRLCARKILAWGLWCDGLIAIVKFFKTRYFCECNLRLRAALFHPTHLHQNLRLTLTRYTSPYRPKEKPLWGRRMDPPPEPCAVSTSHRHTPLRYGRSLRQGPSLVRHWRTKGRPGSKQSVFVITMVVHHKDCHGSLRVSTGWQFAAALSSYSGPPVPCLST